MTSFEILILSLALSVDAFSIAIIACIGASCSHKQILRMASTFGVMHFVMPSLGWFFAFQFRHIISSFDHWLAFFLLALVGAKMLWDAVQNVEDEAINLTKGYALFMVALATSVDTLAVGISFAALNINIWWAVTSISVTCFFVTGMTMYLSRAILSKMTNISRLANILGGLVLIGIGIKILFEHGVF